MKTATLGNERRGMMTSVARKEEDPVLNDLRDIYSDPDTMFVVSVISDAMQRGVRHFKLDGTPLGRLNQIIDALAQDGEILMDAEGSESCPRH
jgi:hypothetical protein